MRAFVARRVDENLPAARKIDTECIGVAEREEVDFRDHVVLQRGRIEARRRIVVWVGTATPIHLGRARPPFCRGMPGRSGVSESSRVFLNAAVSPTWPK